MKKILITGINGYIGRHVAERLKTTAPDIEIVGLDLCKNNFNNDIAFISADISIEARQPELYQKLGRPDVCLHLAWQDGFNHNAESHIDNLSSHYHFLKNLIEHGCRHIAVAGSFREYGAHNGLARECDPVVADNYYAWAKTSLYNLLKIFTAGKDVCLQWLRFFTPYGDDEHNNSILTKILKWEKEGKTSFPFTEGKEQYDYIHIDVLAEQIVRIILQEKINGIINCCSGKPTSLKDMVESFIQEHRLKIRPEYGAFPSRPYDADVIYGDTTKIKQIMNG